MTPFLRLGSLYVLTAALGCSGTGAGGTGDATVTPNADQFGDGIRLSDLLGPAKWVDPAQEESTACNTPSNRNAYVTGVTVVAIDRYDETADGQLGNFYVEDTSLDPEPYSGVTVFDPGFTPPDLRLAVGDVTDMLGALQEFPGPSSGPFPYCRTLPEMGGALSFRFDSGVAKPITIKLDELKSYDKARQWLGMLVRVEGVSIPNEPSNSNGRYNADINVGAGVEAGDVPQLSNELYDLEKDGPPIAAGTTFKAVTGILTYFYRFHLAPRSPDDFEP